MQLHFPLQPPELIVSRDSWSAAFDEAIRLLRHRAFSSITISKRENYPEFVRFKSLGLDERGSPIALLEWMKKFTPDVHPRVKQIELYISKGQTMTDRGPTDSARLDFVFY